MKIKLNDDFNFNTQEICKRFGMVERTIFRSIEKGTLHAIKIRGSWYINELDITDYLIDTIVERYKDDKDENIYEWKNQIKQSKEYKELLAMAEIKALKPEKYPEV